MFDNPAKAGARAILRTNLPKPPYSSLLALSGPEALCVKDMLENDVIVPSSSIDLVERNTNDIFSMARLRDELVHSGRSMSGRINIYGSDIEEFSPQRFYDLVNLDLMSTLTRGIGLWAERSLTPNLLPGAVVMFTFTSWSRGCPFFNWFKDHYAELFPTEAEVVGEILSDHAPSPEEVALAMLISFIFSAHKFDDMSMYRYGGSGKRFNMVCFRVDGITKRGPSIWPRFSHCVELYEEHKRAKRKPSIVLRALPSIRDRFNAWLSESHMTVKEENGREALYYYRSRVILWRKFRTLREVMHYVGYPHVSGPSRRR